MSHVTYASYPMVSRQAQKRLNKEYKSIAAAPPPFVIAKPNDENILEWHYVITGPTNTPYEGGQYHGVLRFPSEYPFKPPLIMMVTPNGRFSCNTRLCLSISDYHPDTWNPAWSVSTILTGLLSFMTGNELTTGSISSTDIVKRKLAQDSRRWNSHENARFCLIFADLDTQNRKELAAEAEKPAEANDEVPGGAVAKLGELDAEDRARMAQTLQDKSGFSVAIVGVVFVAAVAVYYMR